MWAEILGEAIPSGKLKPDKTRAGCAGCQRGGESWCRNFKWQVESAFDGRITLGKEIWIKVGGRVDCVWQGKAS